LRVILSLCAMQVFGYIPDFKFEFKPLRMMSEKEEEEINTQRHNRILSLYDRGLLDSRETGEALASYKLLPIQTEMEQGLLPEPPILPGAATSATGETPKPSGGTII